MVELGIRYCQLTNFLRSFYQLLTRCDVSLLKDLCLIFIFSMVWRDSRFVRIESETNTTSRTRVPLSTKLSDYMWKPYLYLESKYCRREISEQFIGKEVNLTEIKTDVKDIGNKFNLVKDLPLVFYIPTNQNIGKGGVVPLQLWCSMKFDRYNFSKNCTTIT